jgi:hypothetical protein
MSTPCSLILKRYKVSKIFSGSRAFQIPPWRDVPWAVSTFFCCTKISKQNLNSFMSDLITKESDWYRNKSRNFKRSSKFMFHNQKSPSKRAKTPTSK